MLLVVHHLEMLVLLVEMVEDRECVSMRFFHKICINNKFMFDVEPTRVTNVLLPIKARIIAIGSTPFVMMLFVLLVL